MDVSKSRVFVIFLFCVNWVFSQSSVCKKGEDPFVILNLFNNKVYADGKEIPTGATLDIYLRVYHITAFCIPSQTRLLAVTNVLDQHNGAYLIGSLGEKLVTNNEWRCVESTNDDDWFEVMYDDRKWPPAHTNPAPTAFPNISQNALSISASPNPSKKYYCRAWIGGKPSISELLTRSAYATKVGVNQRLSSNLIRSVLVGNILDCVTRCLDYDKCVSMNFENVAKRRDDLKRCELNSESNNRGNLVINDEFDYYHIVRP